MKIAKGIVSSTIAQTNQLTLYPTKEYFRISDILENLSTQLIGDFIKSVGNIRCPTAIFTPEYHFF